MSFRFFRFLTFSLSIMLLSAEARAQNAPAPAAQTQPPAAAPAGAQAPDYPDPRTFTVSLFYWLSANSMGTQPSLFGGKTAPDYENVPNLGQPKNSPGIELSYPITRTGELKLEGFLIKGTGSSYATKTTDPFDSGVPFNPGDYLASQYQIKNLHLYLDDLLFPHKFPVSRFRLKSLWGIEWLQIHTNVTSALAASPVIADNTNNIVYPTFGIAAEYAIAPHLLFRVSTDGFAFPHKSVLGEAQGELSYRRGSFEVVGGEKFLHFKSSPNTSTYISGTILGAFAGVRWHF